MNTHLEDLDVSGLISHKPWSVAPGSLILTVVIAGPAGLGSNYPEGAPPEVSHPWARLTWTVKLRKEHLQGNYYQFLQDQQ